MHSIEDYVEYCDNNLKDIPYLYEPLLMQDSHVEPAMIQAKKLSWKIYDETKRLHKRSAKKNKMVKIKKKELIGNKVRIHFETTDISKLKDEEKLFHIERIKSYKNNHPEKCYLNKLQK